MVITIKAFRIIDGQVTFPPKTIGKYDNTHKFGFDIFETKNWVPWLLKNYGDIKDNHNFPLTFMVVGYGVGKSLFAMYNKTQVPFKYTYVHNSSNKQNLSSIINLFPGRTEDGKKRDLLKFGVIQNY